MMPDASPRLTGDPRPESTPSSCAASVKPMEIPAPTDARRDRRRRWLQVSVQAKAVAKDRCQRGNGPVHQPRKSRLDIGENEGWRSGRIAPPLATSSGAWVSVSRRASDSCAFSCTREIAEQLAGFGIGSTRCSRPDRNDGRWPSMASASADLRSSGEVRCQPVGLAIVIPAHMLTADQRNAVAEFLLCISI